jgi:SAM-dependent methyltransferase
LLVALYHWVGDRIIRIMEFIEIIWKYDPIEEVQTVIKNKNLTQPMDEYRKNACIYDLLIGPFLHPVYRDMVDILKAHGCLTCLDLCCGTGMFVGRAQKCGLIPSGVDISPAMLGVARTNYPDIDFLECDASDLPMGEGGFDAVTISFALHEKPREIALDIIQEAIRLVRAGGLLVVADYRHSTERKSLLTGWGVRCVERMAGREHHAHFHDYMKRGGTEAFLTEAGLNATHQATCMGGWAGVFVYVMDGCFSQTNFSSVNSPLSSSPNFS